MPVRFVDRSTRLATMAATFASATASLSGTHTAPPARSGVINAQMGGHTAALSGVFQPTSSSVGTLAAAVANAISAISGSAVPPVGTWPIGIPPPPVDPALSLPTLPSPWIASTAGFYYVRQGGSASGNGTPIAPRGTLPNPIPANAVVVVDNTANLAVSNFGLTMSGSSGSRCWLVGSQRYGLGSGSTQAQIRHSSSAGITSTHAVIDGIDFFTTGTNDLWGFFPKNTLIRNCTLRGDATQRTGNNSHSFAGSSAANRCEDSLVYNCVVRDCGLWTFFDGVNDVDVHGVQLGRYISRLWFIQNQFYHNQGDGIQATGMGNTNQNNAADIDHVYVGFNTFYENLQTGCWWKLGLDCIVSQNTFYNFTNGGGSAPVATGAQYDHFNRIWWIANRIYDCSGGIRIAGNNNGVAGRDVYMIGNVITNCSGTNGTIQTGSAFSDGCAIAQWQAIDIWVAFNTISGFAGHGIAIAAASSAPIIENNIIQGRTNTNCTDFRHENISGGESFVRNNQFPASMRCNVNDVMTTSLAAFQSGNPSRRTNNRSSATNFVNAVAGPSGDFSLQAGDGAINAGLLTTDVFAIFEALYGIDIRKDFLGVVRPQGGLYDIGAYERSA